MKLTDANYFSAEADKEFMSVSQFKRWQECPAAAKAQYVDGTYKPETSDAMLLGSYFHGLFDGTAESFLVQTPELMTAKCQKIAAVKQLDEIFERVSRDEFFMNACTGQHEEIYTAELFGTIWKCKVDVVDFDKGFFTDIKTVKDFSLVWDNEKRAKLEFYQASKYDLQLAVYQAIIKAAAGYELEPFIAAITKEKVPDYAVFEFTSFEMKEHFESLLNNVGRRCSEIKDMKQGASPTWSCGVCEYCKKTKKLTKTIEARIV